MISIVTGPSSKRRLRLYEFAVTSSISATALNLRKESNQSKSKLLGRVILVVMFSESLAYIACTPEIRLLRPHCAIERIGRLRAVFSRTNRSAVNTSRRHSCKNVVISFITAHEGFAFAQMLGSSYLLPYSFQISYVVGREMWSWTTSHFRSFLCNTMFLGLRQKSASVLETNFIFPGSRGPSQIAKLMNS